MNETVTNLTNAEPWLQLGIAGAALFIVLVVIILAMRGNQSQSNNSNTAINNLCAKIDRLVESNSESMMKLMDSNSETNRVLTTTLTQWNVEQKSNTNYLEQIAKSTADQNGKLDSLHGKMDSLLTLKCRANLKEEE